MKLVIYSASRAILVRELPDASQAIHLPTPVGPRRGFRFRSSDRLADYVRVRAFECVRVRVVDYDHVEKFCSPL